MHRAQQSRWVQLALADPALLIQHLDRNTTLLTIFWLTLMAASSALLVAHLGQLVLGVDQETRRLGKGLHVRPQQLADQVAHRRALDAGHLIVARDAAARRALHLALHSGALSMGHSVQAQRPRTAKEEIGPQSCRHDGVHPTAHLGQARRALLLWVA